MGRETVIRLNVEDEGGTLVDAASLPTVAVTDGAGTTVSGVSAVVKESTGVYKATIPPQTVMDRLTPVWSYTVAGFTRTEDQEVLIAGRRLVNLSRYRTDAELGALGAVELRQVADAVEDWFRKALGFPAVPEPFRITWDERLPGRFLVIPGARFLLDVYAITYAGTAFAAGDLANVAVRDSGAALTTGANWSPGTYTVYGAHGLVRAPAEMERAAIALARYVARTSNYPERASRVISQGSEVWLSMPDSDHPTGLPEVDGVINAYRWPGI